MPKINSKILLFIFPILLTLSLLSYFNNELATLKGLNKTLTNEIQQLKVKIQESEPVPIVNFAYDVKETKGTPAVTFSFLLSKDAVTSEGTYFFLYRPTNQLTNEAFVRGELAQKDGIFTGEFPATYDKDYDVSIGVGVGEGSRILSSETVKIAELINQNIVFEASSLDSSNNSVEVGVDCFDHDLFVNRVVEGTCKLYYDNKLHSQFAFSEVKQIENQSYWHSDISADFSMISGFDRSKIQIVLEVKDSLGIIHRGVILDVPNQRKPLNIIGPKDPGFISME